MRISVTLIFMFPSSAPPHDSNHPPPPPLPLQKERSVLKQRAGVSRMVFLPQGTGVVVGGLDGITRHHDLLTGELWERFGGEGDEEGAAVLDVAVDA